MEERNNRKVLQGRVVSDKMEKTITVQVDTFKFQHMVNVSNILRNTKHMMKTIQQKWVTSSASRKLVHCQKTNTSVLLKSLKNQSLSNNNWKEVLYK